MAEIQDITEVVILNLLSLARAPHQTKEPNSPRRSYNLHFCPDWGGSSSRIGQLDGIPRL